MFIKLARTAIRMAPDSLATTITRNLAAKTQRLAVSAPEQQALDQARVFTFGDDYSNVAWVVGDGPTVVFVHGWNGRASQMAPLAVQIAASGYRCVVFDVTGHGESHGKRTQWDYFFRDIAALSKALPREIYAYVGHSAGALTMMAARKLKGIDAARYVCICAPSYPYPPIAVIRKKLNPPAAVLARYEAIIASQFESTWECLKTGSAYTNAGSDTLLFYDETDRFIDHREGDTLHALCPGSRLIKTRSYGHQKILAAPELTQAICEFLG